MESDDEAGEDEDTIYEDEIIDHLLNTGNDEIERAIPASGSRMNQRLTKASID